jgi:hypothetical protein
MWVAVGAAVLVVGLVLALLWQRVFESERSQGSPSLTRQRTWIGWDVLVLG